MKNLTLLILISLLLISCGKKEIKKVRIDPAFDAHIEEFKQNSQRAGNSVKIDNLVMEFVSSLDQYNKTGNTLGVCYQSYREEVDLLGNKKVYATPVIHIDRGDWDNKLNSKGRKQLSFHELGHCILGRPHSESTSSIMYPYHNVVQNSFSNKTLYNSMVYELFNPNRTITAVGFQAVNIASTMDEPDSEVLENESLDEFANTNMNEEETGHIVHDEDCHKIIKIESKEDF